MKRLKILYISHTARTAGAEKCLLTLVRHLDREAFEPVVLLPVDGALRKELEECGVRTVVSPVEWWMRPPRNYGLLGSTIRDRVNALTRIIDAERPAVIQSNTSVIWEGALAAAFSDVAHVWHLHENLTDHPSISPLFPLPLVYGLMDILSDRIVAVSESVKRSVAGPISADKIRVIPNSIDALPVEMGSGTSLRAELGIADDTAVAVTIGSLIREKGHNDLIDAALHVQQQGGRVAFVIAGGGETAAIRALRERIGTAGLGDVVHLLGYRRDVHRLLDAADMVVVPSLSESFSLVALEAMAAGKPVVATDCGGPAEIVVDGVTGFIVPVANPSALGNRVLALAASRTTAQAMGEKGKERFARLYTAERYAANFADLYRELAGRAKVQLGKQERILLRGMMETYQSIAEDALASGMGDELAGLLRRIATGPLKLLQSVMDRAKKHRR